MFLRIQKGNKRIKTFQYTIGEETITGLAGELLCKMMDFDWDMFVYEYGYYLHTQDEKTLVRIEQQFAELSAPIQRMFDGIFPPNWHSLKELESVSDVLLLIKRKISTNEASYDYFHFVLTNFYGYKPPVFPIQEHEISFLGYLKPLIDKYCPIKYCEEKYKALIDEINGVTNTITLEQLLLDLRDLLKEESAKRTEYSFVKTDRPAYRVFEYDCKKICGLIEWYCFHYVDGNGSYYYNYDPEELYEKDLTFAADKAELVRLNRETNFALIQRLCEEEEVPYKSFFIDLLYSYNQKNPSNKYYLENAFDLICHAILFCYESSMRPIAQCKYCRKYFPREENSQEVCRNCKDLTGNKKNARIKEIFGVDLYGVINNIYRRLCYGKDGKLSYDKYNIREDPLSDDMLLTPAQSETLVTALKEVKNLLSQDVYTAYERYLGYQDDAMKQMFVEFVVDWVKEIDRYYTLDTIKSLILASKAEAERQHLTNPILHMKQIRLNIVHIEEEPLDIELVPAK